MQINKTNNIIFLKNIKSNIIEEAIVILRKEVKLENIQNDDDNNKINILKEAEDVINEHVNNEKIKFDKYRIDKLEKKIKKMKIINLALIIIFLLTIFL